MSAAGICLCFAGIAFVPQRMGRRLRHVGCRLLLLFCRYRARTEKIGAGIAMSAAGICFCFAGIAFVPKKCGAGIAMSAEGTCFCFAGITLIWKNGAQAPHPVWVFKNLKEGRCRGKAVANATAERIEGSIVCKTKFQTGL